MVQQCAGCQLPIADKFLLKVLDRVWHASCVQCIDCKCALTERCFSREGKLFCRNDFYRRYGTKCAGCDQGISPNDMVRRAKHLVFHVECFVCSYCKRQIATGDELYYIGEGSFICREDYYQTHHNIDESEEDPKDLSYGLDEDLDAALASKRRGPRTTIKAKQLEALKSTFAATPKPSRNIREKLAQETGLNMRVIQVWFQNRRSKERRLKQSGGQTATPRPARPSRRSRMSRLNSSEVNNENQPELQNMNSSHLSYQQQDLHTPPPGHYGTPGYNDFYSQNSPVSEGLVMNNSQMAHGTNFVAGQHLRGGPMPNNELTETGNGLAGSTMAQIAGQMSPNGTGVFNTAAQPQNNIGNPAPSDVW